MMDNKTPQLSPESVAAPEAEPAVPATAGKRGFVSAGQHVHKWSTYLGIDWLFNTVAGVAFAYWGKHTSMGQKLWNTRLTGFFEKQLGRFIKDEVKLAHSTDKGVMFSSIIAGGMFTIPPLMVLENNKIKKSITKFYDGMIYGKDKVESDPKFEESYRQIEEAPKKDFASGMIGRVFALAPLLAIVIVPKSRDLSDKYYFSHIAKGSKFVAKTLRIQPKGLMEMRPQDIEHAAQATARLGEKIAPQTRWDYIHATIAMDFGLGLPYAILHEFFYNMFANMLGKKSHAVATAPTPVAIAKAAAVIPEPPVVEKGDGSRPSLKVKEIRHVSMLDNFSAIANPQR